MKWRIPRPVIALAALAMVVLLSAACGGAPSGASLPADNTSTPAVAAGAGPSPTYTPVPTRAAETLSDMTVAPPMGIGPREALERFMDARIRRQELAVLGLLTDGLRKVMEAEQQLAAKLSVYQVSNPCWYRYEALSFGQRAPTEAAARVRVYTHFWGGDIMAGPPRLWEQEVILADTPTGWMVDRLSEPQNRREEPDEPRGPRFRPATPQELRLRPRRLPSRGLRARSRPAAKPR